MHHPAMRALLLVGNKISPSPTGSRVTVGAERETRDESELN